jgi:hypothetical protein
VNFGLDRCIQREIGRRPKRSGFLFRELLAVKEMFWRPKEALITA